MKRPKSQSSKEKILETSVRIFARKGFANTGMRELAKEAGVNLAMINYCFGNKKELLKIIIDTFFTGYLAIIEHELTTEGTYDQKIRKLIKAVLVYFSENRNHLIVTLTELPHDDPEIIEHKAGWAKQAMLLFQREICIPLENEYGVKITPIEIGPALLGLLSARFLLEPIIEHVRPPGFDDSFHERYPDIVSNIFLDGINGLAKQKTEE